MNVIVTNEQQQKLAVLDVDIIKNIQGSYTAFEIVEMFKDFFYDKMILDITAIKGYEDINVMQNLSVNFDMSKVILLLDDSEKVNSPMYISQLISMGIYNFTNDVNTIKYLIDNPNQYKDVANYHNIGGFKKPALNERAVDNTRGKIGQKIIGIKNLSEGAGSTTLMQQMVKQLAFNYKVKGIELNGFDAIYFRRPDIIFCNDYTEAETKIQGLKGIDAIIIDLNEFEDKNKICTDIIYLLEPGIIRISKFIKNINKYKDKLNDMKIVLNRSALKDEEINYFEKETGLNIYYNLTNFDDKKDRLLSIDKLLIKLGFNKQQKI